MVYLHYHGRKEALVSRENLRLGMDAVELGGVGCFACVGGIFCVEYLPSYVGERERYPKGIAADCRKCFVCVSPLVYMLSHR